MEEEKDVSDGWLAGYVSVALVRKKRIFSFLYGEASWMGMVRIGNVGAQKSDIFVPMGGLRKLAGSVRISGVGAQKTDFFVPTSQLRCQLGFMRNSGVGVNKTDFYVTIRWVVQKTDSKKCAPAGADAHNMIVLLLG